MAVPDPYGIDVALTEDGDVVVWPNGRVGTFSGADNCVQALKLRFRTVVGELPLHTDYGSAFPTHRFIGAKLDATRLQGEARAELEQLVAQDRRFIAAQDVEVNEVENSAQMAQIKVTLALAGGDALRVVDLAAPRIEEVQEPDAIELADLATVDSFEDFDFIAQDDDELAELADAATTSTLVTEGGID